MCNNRMPSKKKRKDKEKDKEEKIQLLRKVIVDVTQDIIQDYPAANQSNSGQSKYDHNTIIELSLCVQELLEDKQEHLANQKTIIKREYATLSEESDEEMPTETDGEEGSEVPPDALQGAVSDANQANRSNR